MAFRPDGPLIPPTKYVNMGGTQGERKSANNWVGGGIAGKPGNTVSMPSAPPQWATAKPILETQTPGASLGGVSGGGASGAGGGGGYTDAMSIYNQLYAQQQAAAQDLRDKQRAGAEDAWNNREASRQVGFDAITSARQAGYDRGVGQTNEQADTALNQAYINKMMQERNLGQQLSASGRSGGASESTMLGLANNYGTNRAGLEQTRASNIADFDLSLQQGMAQDRGTFEDARANDAMWKFETLSGIDNDYNSKLMAAQQSAAEAQADILMRQAASYSQSSSGSGKSTEADKVAAESAKRVNTAVNEAYKYSRQEDGNINSGMYNNVLQGMYNTGQLSEEETRAALSQSSAVYNSPAPQQGKPPSFFDEFLGR